MGGTDSKSPVRYSNTFRSTLTFGDGDRNKAKIDSYKSSYNITMPISPHDVY